MEKYWDLYDKTNKVVKKGDKLQSDEYHLVINVWIKNIENEFSITQSVENKSHLLMVSILEISVKRRSFKRNIIKKNKRVIRNINL